VAITMNREQQAVAFFVQQGWTLAQAAGIVANLQAESGLRPDVTGDGGLAYGIAQWHPDRQAYFARLNGKPIQGSSFEDQLAFVHAELHSIEKTAGNMLANCKTAREAGACVSIRYERPADRTGEANKRAAIAERIFADSDTQPAAPIGHRDTIQPDEEKDMGAGLVMALVQSLISGFAPLVQQKIGSAITKHGGDPVATASITNAIMNAVGTAVGTPVVNDAQAVAAVAAVQADPAKMAAVQNTAMMELDRLAPVLDKLHQMSKDEWAAEEVSMDNASKRAKEDATPDQDFTLTVSLIAFMGVILVALGAGIGIMVYHKLPYGELLTLFSGAVGVILGKYGTRIDYRYGSSRASAAKDVTIAQMAKR
jgi:hypothetical protein